MAVRQQLIHREPSAVWAVLEDTSKYSDWVVGTAATRPCEGNWPEVESSLTYTVRLGPREFEGNTVVRRLERPRVIELEAYSEPFGSARIALDIRPWGENTLVIADEHPLRGAGARAHNALVDALLQIRHRSMMHRLAKTVEGSTPGPRTRQDA